MTTKIEQPTLLRKVQVAQRLGVSTWSIDRWIRNGTFPKPIYLAPGTPARWRVRDVEAFIDKKKVSRRPRPKLRGFMAKKSNNNETAPS